MTSLSTPTVMLDVPFIGWDDHRLLGEFTEMNRSDPASHGMVWEYWGRDLAELLEEVQPDGVNDWIMEWREGSTIDDLKLLLASRIPILVAPTGLTPFAHPSGTWMYQMGIVEPPAAYTQTEATSGNLSGMFLPLKAFRESEGRPNISVDEHWSAKVVVGYDEGRSIIVLHDPTFGPYWEVSYDDFEAMWEVGDRQHFVMHPPDPRDFLTKQSLDIERISRTSGHEATERYVFGYALSSIGRNEEAETQLRRGLEITDPGEGCRFLILCELSVVRFKRGDQAEAIALAKEASRLLPEHHASWYLLANLYRSNRYGWLRFVSLIRARTRKAGRRRSTRLPRNLLYADNFL